MIFDVAVSSVEHQALPQDQVVLPDQVLKLPDRSVHDLSQMNPVSGGEGQEEVINPNSAILALFQDGEYSYEKSATLRILFGLLAEPCFNQLRTQQQLGYIVHSQYTSNQHSKVLGGLMIIQSSKYGPEYLESRINVFLRNVRAEGGFAKERFENVRTAEIQNLMQVKMNFFEEAIEHWASIEHQNEQFDDREKLLQALQNVSPEMVAEKFEELFFKNPKRLHVKL